MKLKRRRGATLGLVAVCALVIIVIGVGAYYLVRLLGGGRELANATDSGDLNLAKQAIRKPGQDAALFANPDVATNFALLGESPRTLNLMTYNRCVMQAMMVALNARDANTPAAAQDAKKVWTALNNVGSFLRTRFEDPAVMGQYFMDLTSTNNTRMLGGQNIKLGNPVTLSDYDVSYMKHGQSANVEINPIVLSTFAAPPAIPINSTGQSSKNGFKYMAGYQPFTVDLPASGDKLTFSGVPVFPQNSPHLVSLSDFEPLVSDAFATAVGYPANTLPPNSFKTRGVTKETRSDAFTGALSCAIVGCLDQVYQMQIPYGYIMIKNGPPAPGGGGRANEKNDIFNHALGVGIDVSANYFLRARGWGTGPNVFNGKNLVDAWHAYNDYNQHVAQLAAQTPPGQNTWTDPGQPPVGQSLQEIRKIDGSTLSQGDLTSIMEDTSYNCKWNMYDASMTAGQPCFDHLPNFRAGYQQYGSTDGGGGSGDFTALEQFKADVMTARYATADGAAPPCQTLAASGFVSGVKWFDHGSSYAGPPYDFALAKPPYKYLKMIDDAPSNGCGLGATFDALLKRCQQIVPTTTATNLTNMLSGPDLPLQGQLYIYPSNNGQGPLQITTLPPPWAVPNTLPDGSPSSCGKPYNVMGNLVDNLNDGQFGAEGPWFAMPNGKCTDSAIWTPSSGYNNLLGVLSFTDSCAGAGGQFCLPN